MGWSYTRATCFDKSGNIDRREEMRKALFGCTILKDRMVGSTYYAAIKPRKHPETEHVSRRLYRRVD